MECKYCNGNLKFVYYGSRIVWGPGGKRHTVQIREMQCENCGHYQRILPDELMPFRRYPAQVIMDVVNGIVTEDDLEYEDYPCSMTFKRWKEFYSTFIKS